MRLHATAAARRRRTSRPRGFSLLEVLVAFVILSLVATALFKLFGGALANAGAADEYSRAMLVAESVLAESSTLPLREGAKTGNADDGRIEWTARVEPYQAPDPNPDLERASELMPTRLWRVAVDLTFPSPAGGKRTIALSTLRVGSKDMPQ
jgi:general secretion pathway protein I